MSDKDANRTRRSRARQQGGALARQESDKDKNAGSEHVPNVVVVEKGDIRPSLFKLSRHKDKKLVGRKVVLRKRNISDIVQESKAFDSNTVIDGNNRVISKGEIETQNPERETSPPVEMPKGNRHQDPESRTVLRIPFSTAAESIGATLKAARNEAGFTQADVAKSMGTVASAVRRLESGKSSPTIDTLQRYAKAIGYAVDLGFIPDVE